jgi:glycosyltransferase involved in cell wall biosynthesis
MTLSFQDRVSSPAHILCIGSGWFPKTAGGLERYVYELINQFVEKQDRVEFCGVDLPEFDSNASLKLTNLAKTSDPTWQRLWSAQKSLFTQKSPKPDAINLHFVLYSLPLLNQLPKDIPITFTFHGPWASESRQEGENRLNVLTKYCLEQLVYRRCDRFITLSKAFAQILNQDYHIPWERIHVIPGGVDVNRFQPTLSMQEAREQLNWASDRFILFTARRLTQRMGLSQLLSALAQVKTKIPEVWLAVAGKGVMKAQLEQQAQELGLSDHVKFLGFLPDEQLPIAYQAADLVVMPSQALEGFGLVLVEALACGTPTLCTPIGGMPEILAPFCPHLITDSIDEQAIATRLIELLNGTLPLPSRTSCRTYACNQFDWEIIAPQVRQVLLQ